MGLYHTFQGGCTKSAATCVADTPAEKSRRRSAAPRAATPAARPGSTRSSNFMDYTDDACMNTFTAGQDARMDAQFTTYRFGK